MLFRSEDAEKEDKTEKSSEVNERMGVSIHGECVREREEMKRVIINQGVRIKRIEELLKGNGINLDVVEEGRSPQICTMRQCVTSKYEIKFCLYLIKNKIEFHQILGNCDKKHSGQAHSLL